MATAFLVMRYGQLCPVGDGDAEVLQALLDGQVYRCEITKPRNIGFHRKYFALLDVLFEILPEPDPLPLEDLRKYYGTFWGRKFENGKTEADQYAHLQPKKNRDRFRKDLAIVCGFFEVVTDIKGRTKIEARSISFANMEEPEFVQLYNATLDYGLARIATGKTRDEIERWVNQLLDFA